MREFMNFHTNAHVQAMWFKTLFRTTVHGMRLENINTCVLIMVLSI
jgi:hypothetical protein